jgi:hypothetical protein
MNTNILKSLIVLIAGLVSALFLSGCGEENRSVSSTSSSLDPVYREYVAIVADEAALKAGFVSGAANMTGDAVADRMWRNVRKHGFVTHVQREMELQFAATMSPTEMREVVDFLKSPVGKNYVAASNDAAIHLMMISSKWVEDNIDKVLAGL